MFCAKCGRDLPTDASFCSGCGAPATAADAGVVESATGIDEVRIFVGKNADYYQTRFRKFNVGGVENFAPTWNWAAFGFTFWWFLYRKMYWWSLLWLVLTFLPFFGLLFWIAAGLLGNYLYYRHVTARIREARSAPLSSRLPPVLAELGGVNDWVIPVAIVATIAILIVFALFGVGMGLFHGFVRRGIGV